MINDYDTINTLLKIPCFSFYQSDEFNKILESSQTMTIQKNGVIYSENDNFKYNIVVTQGIVKLYKSSAAGKEFLVKFLFPGDCFCYPALTSTNRNFSNAIAFKDAKIILIPSLMIQELLHTKVTPMGLAIIRCLCERLNTFSRCLNYVGFYSVEQRILVILSTLANMRNPNGDETIINLTQQDIAQMVGSSREAVSRTFNKLKSNGVVLKNSDGCLKVFKEQLDKYMLGRQSVQNGQADTACYNKMA